MSDETTWRRLVGPQDALLWWLLPRVGQKTQAGAASALRWADGHMRSPSDLGAWLEHTEQFPSIDPLTVAAYLSTVPLLLGMLRAPANPERVQEALSSATLTTLPPGLPQAAERALSAMMRQEEALLPSEAAAQPVRQDAAPPVAQPTPQARPVSPPAAVPPQGPSAPLPPAHGGGGAPPPWRGVRLTPDTRRAIQWAHASAALNVTQWADAVRSDLRWQTMISLKAGRSYRQQARVLRDRYTQWGADFERVALTEAHGAMMAGRLLGYPDGATVRAILAPGACPDCKRLLAGKTFTVRHEPGDAWSDVWPGKTNAGLPKARWRPCIPEHPRCRCVWVLATRIGAGES